MIKNIIYVVLCVVCKIFPIINGILFCSFNGKYSDSPKAISEKLHELHPEEKIYWLLSSKNDEHVPSYVKVIGVHSLKAYIYQQCCKAIVDNTYCKKGLALNNRTRTSSVMMQKAKRRKGQKLFSTWHGTPLKRMGRDQIGNEDKGFLCDNLTMFHGNKFTMEVMDRITFNTIHMELLGSPRNDLLFQKNNHFRERLGLPAGKKIVLYAPTFRTDSSELQDTNIQRSGLVQLESIDYDGLFDKLTRRFGGNWVFVGRFHYFVEQSINWEALEKRYPGKIINGNLNDDMAEYLACADILITDASSSMFDFALTGKPCFLYFPDVEHYEKVERGFYFDIQRDLPFPLSVNFDELCEQIQSFDEEKYAVGIKELLENIGNIDDGNSSKRVVEYIVEHIK